MNDIDITWLLMIIICILSILCSLLYLSNNNQQINLSNYLSDARSFFASFLNIGNKVSSKVDSSNRDYTPPRGENRELFNDILNDKQSDESLSPSSSSDEDVDSEEESDENTRNSVIDYETYNRVCEDYRKTTLALKERESEVASLMKELETKSLTIKMLNDKLLSYGSTIEKSIPIDNSREIINQQRQMIESLLSADGNADNIDKFLSMYESKVKELADAKQLIEKMKSEYSQFETLQKKGELVDKLMIENEALRARLRMEIQVPSYSFAPMPGYPYPPLPPGFGYSQNTSVTDGNSIGVLEEDLHGPAVMTALNSVGADFLSTASQSSLQKVRTLKLKNKVYFQLVEATNAIQKIASKKGGTITKLSSASITKIARSVRDIESSAELKKTLLEIMPCIQLCTEAEYEDYVSQLRLALSKQ